MFFSPVKAFMSIFEITPAMLKKWDIQGVILDIDNTMAPHNDPKPLKGIDEWIAGMKKNNIQLVIVSNNHAPRVEKMGARLGIDFIAEGAKPLPVGFAKAVKKMGLDRKNVCAVGDQIFTDIMGANIYGIRSFMVKPIAPEKSLPFRIKRMIEKPFLPKKYKN